MTTRNTLPALILSALITIGAQAVANAETAFDAKDSVAVLEAKAADWFVGRSIIDIKDALQQAGYRDVLVIELSDTIAPGALLVEEGVVLTSDDVHLVMKQESTSGFATNTSRISFFLRMQHGICSEVLRARKFTK